MEKIREEKTKNEQESVFMALLQKMFEGRGRIEDVETKVSALVHPLDLFLLRKDYLIGAVKIIQYMSSNKGDHSKREIQEGAKVSLSLTELVVANSRLLEIAKLNNGKPRKIGGTLMYKLGKQFQKL